MGEANEAAGSRFQTAETGTRWRGGRSARLVAGLLVLSLVVTGCSAARRLYAKHRVSRGEARLVAYDMEAALAEFRAAAELDPQLAVAHSRMGVIYRRMGKYVAAIDCFVEAVRHDPFSFDDAFNLGQLYHFTERVKEAIQAYLHAVELQPEDFDAQLNLGVCYQQAGDLDQAVDRFQRAIDVDPHRPHAYVNLGVALTGQERYYEAIRAYKEALERDSEQPLVLINLAHAYMKQDRFKMARITLEQTIRMDSQLAVAHESLGYCLFCMKDFDGAEESYQRALACDWRLPRAHSGLGSINMLRYLKDDTLTDRRDRALEHWHRSLELKPDQPRIHKLLARYSPEHQNPEAALLVKGTEP